MTKMTTPTKNRVTFKSPEAQLFWYEGVSDDEADDVWFRRADYVEFVEAELRRRVLEEIECHLKGSTNEVAMKHTFTRTMVSREFSSGPPRRPRPVGRAKTELDWSNHTSQYTKSRKKTTAVATQQARKSMEETREAETTGKGPEDAEPDERRHDSMEEDSRTQVVYATMPNKIEPSPAFPMGHQSKATHHALTV